MDKGDSTPEDIEKLKKMVPKSYQKYIESKYHFFFFISNKLNNNRFAIYSVWQRLFNRKSPRPRTDRGRRLDDD